MPTMASVSQLTYAKDMGNEELLNSVSRTILWTSLMAGIHSADLANLLWEYGRACRRRSGAGWPHSSSEDHQK